MARTKIKIDRKKFNAAIKQAEKDGPLPNRSELYKTVAEIYNGMVPPQDRETGRRNHISFSVVSLRVKEWEIKVKTPVGKRGRAAGVPMSDEQKKKMQASRKNRKSKGEKFENSDEAQEHFGYLKKTTPKRFHAIIDAIAKGSRTAAVKLQCLQCCGWVTKEVRSCSSIKICPLFLFRPYQSKEDAAEFDADGGNEPDKEVAA